jgi:hypothetical protein
MRLRFFTGNCELLWKCVDENLNQSPGSFDLEKLLGHERSDLERNLVFFDDN